MAASLQELKDKRLKAFSDKLKSENDAIFQKVRPLFGRPPSFPALSLVKQAWD